MHVFLCNVPEFIVSQPIFEREAQQGIKNRIDRPAIRFEVGPKTLHASINIHLSVFVERFESLLPLLYIGAPDKEPNLMFATIS